MSENPNKVNYFVPESKLKPKHETPTIRLDISLAPTSNGYAEINYRNLITAYSKTQEVNSGQEMSSPSLTDARSRFSDDIRYKTLGYDITDSFIDDSDVFDEHVSPKLPGFYINYQQRGCKPVCQNNGASTSKQKAIIVADDVQSGVKENILGKRKTDLNTDFVKPKKCKRVNRPGDIQFIKEVIRKPLSPSMKKNLKYNVKNSDGKASDDVERKCPELPPHLPENLLKCIALLKENAVLSKSKSVILNDDSKKLFIDFELQLLPFNFKVRSDIYMHLSYYFSLSPATLKRKSKTLVVKKLSDDIDEATLKLANEIQRLALTNSQPREDVSQPPADFSPDEQSLLLTIFRLKKKLFDIQRTKTKNFLDHLAELLKEEIRHMWLPSQMKLPLLINLASNFYTTECKVKPQKTEKQKGSPLSTEKNV